MLTRLRNSRRDRRSRAQTVLASRRSLGLIVLGSGSYWRENRRELQESPAMGGREEGVPHEQAFGSAKVFVGRLPRGQDPWRGSGTRPFGFANVSKRPR